MTAQWTDPAESAKHIAWTRAFYDAIEPHAHGSHFLNFNSEAERRGGAAPPSASTTPGSPR